MSKLSDGGYYIGSLVKAFNLELDQIGDYGHRAKICLKGNAVCLRFNFPDGNGSDQKVRGLGKIPKSVTGIEEAKKIARYVTLKLSDGEFSWSWFNDLIGKPNKVASSDLNPKDVIALYKDWYFKEKKACKQPEQNWYSSYSKIEALWSDKKGKIDRVLIEETIAATENNTATRRIILNALSCILSFLEIDKFNALIAKYKSRNTVKKKRKKVPSDLEIREVFHNGFEIRSDTTNKAVGRLQQWQFLYGLLAVYGLRVHEAWHIKNWDKPVILDKDDWVDVSEWDDSKKIESYKNGTMIPAILDPLNEHHLLAIGNSTKTGYRLAFPLSPSGENWVTEFGLINKFNIPIIKDPLNNSNPYRSPYNCSQFTASWFRRRKYGFTPHSLRHAYNHRGQRLGINLKVLASSLGHTLQTNLAAYTNTINIESKPQDMIAEINKKDRKQSELEKLTLENKKLKLDNQQLRLEVKRLTDINRLNELL